MGAIRTSVFAGATLTFILALTGVIAPAMQRGVSSAAESMIRHDIIWIGQSGRLELDDFTHAALEYRWSPSAPSHDRLRASHALLLLHLENWTTGAFGAFVETSPERIALLEEIVQQTLKAERLFGRLNEPIIADTFFKIMGEIEPLMERMVGQAFEHDVRDMAVRREKLQLLHLTHQGVTTILLASLLLLTLLLALRKGLSVSTY